VSHGGQKEDKILLQPSQHYHKDEFQHISISARQRSQWRGQNLCGPFLRAILLMTVGLAMADSRETKGLITPPPRWVSAQLFEALHNYLRQCTTVITMTKSQSS